MISLVKTKIVMKKILWVIQWLSLNDMTANKQTFSTFLRMIQKPNGEDNKLQQQLHSRHSKRRADTAALEIEVTSIMQQ